jgi:hypothetical protein
MTDALLEEVTAEIERLHDFFAGWFQGTIPDDAFEDGIANRLHPEFENVQPAGHILTCDTLLGPLRGARGVNPGFRIEVREVRILGQWPGAGLVLAGYVEAQFGARNTVPSDNLRRSTVLFERMDDALVWRYVHETALNNA